MKRHAWFVLTIVVALFALATTAPAQDAPPVNLDDPDRPESERERDRWSKPIEVLEWIGVEPGDDVVDYHAGSGYATWILSRWVGPEGTVYAEMPGGDDELEERIETGDLAEVGNVEFVAGIDELPTDGLDLFYIVRYYHDIDAGDAPSFLDEVGRTLRPGGLLVVIDARTDEGRDEDAHRIADDTVIDEITAAGFELVESTDLLANPDDDHEGAGWDNRNRLDHMALKFRWPGDPDSL